MKFHGNKVSYFYENEIPKVDSNHPCWTVISLDSPLNKDRNYYSQEFKYIKKKVARHINDNLSHFPSDDDSDDSNVCHEE